MSADTGRRTGLRPLVSVLLPVHNGARFLDAAIHSIQAQTLTNLELIVLDDGSTDGSGEIAERRAATDPRLRVLSLGRVGLTAALNIGIEVARAEWIARMDADDVAIPERLERQLCVLCAQPDIAALGSYGWIVGPSDRVVGLSRLGPVSREAFACERAEGLIYLLHPSVIFSGEVVRALGGYRSAYAPSDDVDLWARIADDHVVLTLPEPLLAYRMHAANDSTRRFIAATAHTRWARVNALRRRSGQPELSWEEYQDLERQKPQRQRVQQWLTARSQYWYRRGGSLLAAGNPLGLLGIGLGAILDPPLVLHRLRRQKVLATALRQGRSRGALQPTWVPAIEDSDRSRR